MKRALDDYQIINDLTLHSGSSSGSFMSAFSCASADNDFLFNTMAQSGQTCAQGQCVGHLADFVRSFLTAILPTDVHVRCLGRLFVHLTKADPSFVLPTASDPTCTAAVLGNATVWPIYLSKDDVINALVASSFIGSISNASCSTAFRSKQYMDGGFSDDLPAIPEDVSQFFSFSGAITLRVATAPQALWVYENFKAADIYPGMRGSLPAGFNLSNWFSFDFSPAIIPLVPNVSWCFSHHSNNNLTESSVDRR